MTGKELEKRLMSFGISISDISNRAKKSEKYLLRNIFNKVNVGTREIENIALAFGYPVSTFFEDLPPSHSKGKKIIVNRGPIMIDETQEDLSLHLNDGEELQYITIGKIMNGEIDVYSWERYREFKKYPNEDYIYLLFKNESECILRYLNKEGIHTHYYDALNYSIKICEQHTLRLCLYRDGKEEIASALNISNSSNTLATIWEEYKTRASFEIADKNDKASSPKTRTELGQNGIKTKK